MAAKQKDFRDNPALSFMSGAPEAQGAPEAPETQRAPETQGTSGTQKAPRAYRIHLKLKPEFREYLDEVSWQSRMSVTRYINNLIEADKAARSM